MADILHMTYGQTGSSTQNNELGMREMQARAFEKRCEQYLLIKSPPASGKSRALMFLALDKIINQGLRKAIVAVPEMSIGSSFQSTALTEHGFFADWEVKPEHNLCTAGSNASKTAIFTRFITGPDKILVCTHATLRFAFEKLDPQAFNECVIAIDEFHHVSADEDSRLGDMIDKLMSQSDVHLIAMTGSYFRGDAIPIMKPDDEAKFAKVTYSYYEQLNGYRYLKSLGIGYHFYQGEYTSALPNVLDSRKKTIVHIPSVNSVDAGGIDKAEAVDKILDVLGVYDKVDPDTGLYLVKRKDDGKILRIADLVNDVDKKARAKVQNYLRNVKSANDVDIIIALGMAKEGFDWPYCEHVLTIGFRSSVTEIVQIIGRATRDCEGKTHAQFTNLIAQPDEADEDVKGAVNNMLKAITMSLLMEQILAPNVRFTTRKTKGEENENTIVIGKNPVPVSERVREILNGGPDEILKAIMDNGRFIKSLPDDSPAEMYTQVALPQAIKKLYPYLSDEEMEQLRISVLYRQLCQEIQKIINEANKGKGGTPIPDPSPTPEPIQGSGEKMSTGGTRIIKMGDRFINIDDLPIDLIEKVNPFKGAFEVMSKSLTPAMFKTIKEAISANRAKISEEEATMLYPQLVAFRKEHGRPPSLMSNDPFEVRFAEALAYLRKQKLQRIQQGE